MRGRDGRSGALFALPGNLDRNGGEGRFWRGLQVSRKGVFGTHDGSARVVGKRPAHAAEILLDPAEAKRYGRQQGHDEDQFALHKYLGSGHNSGPEPNSNRAPYRCQSTLVWDDNFGPGVAPDGGPSCRAFAIYNERLARGGVTK